MQRPFNRVNSKTYWKSAWNRNDGKKIEKIRIMEIVYKYNIKVYCKGVVRIHCTYMISIAIYHTNNER